MKLDLSKPFEAKKAMTRLIFLTEKGANIDLIEKQVKRSLNQNSYQHALFALFAMEFGYTLREVKQIIFKRIVNESIFKTEFTDKQTGVLMRDYRSTADLSKEENTTCIERFRNYSSDNGLYLLSSEEYIENSFYIDQEIEKHKEFL